MKQFSKTHATASEGIRRDGMIQRETRKKKARSSTVYDLQPNKIYRVPKISSSTCTTKRWNNSPKAANQRNYDL